MNLTGLIHLFVFPGLLFAVPAGWFFVWGEHKAVARMQQRIGPPLLQPFYDFVKLIGKRTPSRHGIEANLLRLWPVLSVLSLIGALALLPVAPAGRGFSGDSVLLVALLELPSICFILAGFTSGSIYGEIGSIREAVLSVANNVVFLLSIVTIAVTEKTFRLSDLAGPRGILATGSASSASCFAFPRSCGSIRSRPPARSRRFIPALSRNTPERRWDCGSWRMGWSGWRSPALSPSWCCRSAARGGCTTSLSWRFRSSWFCCSPATLPPPRASRCNGRSNSTGAGR
jgi:hypothetical protein